MKECNGLNMPLHQKMPSQSGSPRSLQLLMSSLSLSWMVEEAPFNDFGAGLIVRIHIFN